jgi:radical SAM superfamily enzyme with C-terminal helix-hairpin-helix motif
MVEFGLRSRGLLDSPKQYYSSHYCLVRIYPQKIVYLERYDRNFTHGRQIATYALLFSIPYQAAELNTFQDILVTGHGYRSVSGLLIPITLVLLLKKYCQFYQALGEKNLRKFC